MGRTFNILQFIATTTKLLRTVCLLWIQKMLRAIRERIKFLFFFVLFNKKKTKIQPFCFWNFLLFLFLLFLTFFLFCLLCWTIFVFLFCSWCVPSGDLEGSLVESARISRPDFENVFPCKTLAVINTKKTRGKPIPKTQSRTRNLLFWPYTTCGQQQHIVVGSNLHNWWVLWSCNWSLQRKHIYLGSNSGWCSRTCWSRCRLPFE